MTGPLADPLAARDHARAMAGTVVEAMPTVPPVADDLPADVSNEDLLWEETIAPGGYATRRLSRGSRLRQAQPPRRGAGRLPGSRRARRSRRR